MAAVRTSRVAGGDWGMPPLLRELPQTVVFTDKVAPSDDLKSKLASCCGTNKPNKIPESIDGKPTIYVWEDKHECWAPGFTREAIAANLENGGSHKEKGQQIHAQFAAKLGKLNGTINKKRRDPTGMMEVMQDFGNWSNQMLQAYQAVGFKGRQEVYAGMHLTVNFMKTKYKERFDQVMNMQGNAVRQTVLDFLTREPWDTQVDSLKAATMVIQPSVTEAQMGTFLISAQNGDIDTPSFHVTYSALMSTGAKGALDRLAKWFASGDAEVYEIRIIIDAPVTASYQHVVGVIQGFSSSLAGVKLELFSLAGTTNITEDGYYIKGQPKITTVLLQGLAASKHKADLIRLSITDCYVDYETMEAVASVIRGSSVTALKLSKLQLGLDPKGPPPSMDWPKRTISPMDGVQDCLCHCKVKPCCCFCCTYATAHAQSMEEVKLLQAKFEQDYEVLKHDCARSLISAFQAMAKNGNVDVIDLTGTDLPSMCGKVQAVSACLSALSFSQPTALVLTDCGLTDLHMASICDVFFLNPLLLHVDLTLTCSNLESLEILQNLFQNSPLVVSGSLTSGKARTFRIAKPLQLTELDPKHYCLCGIQCGFKVGPCCHSVTEVHVKQPFEEFTLPEKVRSGDDFSTFREKIESEIDEHLIIPLFTVLHNIWSKSEKKLKNLMRASKDGQYSKVFSPEADKPKLQLFADFVHDVHLDTSPDAMWELNKGDGLEGVSMEALMDKELEEKEVPVQQVMDPKGAGAAKYKVAAVAPA